MPQTGIHAAIGYQFKRIVPYEKGLFPALIFGAILPDLDVLAVAIGSIFTSIHQAETILHRTFSHSIFAPVLIFLLFAFLSEFKSKPFYKSVGKGLALGMLSHIVLDIFFWFRGIHIFWPLPFQEINLWEFWTAPGWLQRLLLVLEFLCFRWYAWFLINRSINYSSGHIWLVKPLKYWMVAETQIFILFIILAYWNPAIFMVLFGAAYIPSLIIALWATYMCRHALDFNLLEVKVH